MSVYAHVDGLGEVVENLLADCVLEWRQEFRPGHQTVDTIAEHLKSVETTLNLRPAGVAILTVSVHGRGFNELTVNCFRLKRATLGRWIIGASSLKQKYR